MSKDAAQKIASIVRALYDAYRDGRRAEAEALLAAEFRFTSPYDDAIDRAAFFARCWPNGDRISDFRIERIAVDHDGAFVTYFCTTKAGASFRNTEYLTVKNGQVTSANVYFGASYQHGVFMAKPDE